MSLATDNIYRTILKVNAIHCNGPDALLLTKYLGKKQLWKIHQFLPNIIKSIRQYERINKKICKQKMSIMFKEICINEEMLPKYAQG